MAGDSGFTFSRKLNNSNYKLWRSCMESYLIGNNLWDVTCGESTNPPTDPREKTRWNAKVDKALYAIKQSVDDDMLICISNIKTSKEAWDTFAGFFSKKNTHRLQLLEREIGSLEQGKLSITEYFLKMKTSCQELSLLDLENRMSECKLRRLLINGLRSEYVAYCAAIAGWATQPMVDELENLLINHEFVLAKSGTMKVEEKEEALLSNFS
jgi:hypothetical protein